MINKFKEWLSIQIAKNPRRVILMVILFFNLIFIGFAALVIMYLAPETLKEEGWGISVFYTLSMILDAGYMMEVISDVGIAGAAVILVCLATVIIGMITFTGAIIGYMTNYIANFISNVNAQKNRLKISGHIVVLNWNTRGAEIINDMLYSSKPEKVVILVSEKKEVVEKEVSYYIADTLMKERVSLAKRIKDMPFFDRIAYMRTHMLKNKVTVIVREGDTFSLKQLNDISLNKAEAVLILGKELQNSVCTYGQQEKINNLERGDSDIIKTLVQVAEITAAEDSANNQKIIVEVSDNWTLEIVNKIIAQKERLGKCNIVPLAVNKILGQLLAQFSVMPELNLVYNELFSNKGATFYSVPKEMPEEENSAIKDYLMKHKFAIPVGYMDTKMGTQAFYVAGKEEDIYYSQEIERTDYCVVLNKDYWLPQKNILILGHNSKIRDIMDGFNAFRAEWNPATGSEILNVVIIDDQESIDKNNYSDKYSYVNKAVPADIYNKKAIYKEVGDFIEKYDDASVLILSDDKVQTQELDAKALVYLIYIRDIIDCHNKDVNVIVEIINPKNYDVVLSYSVNNVVISNRYISKLATQIGEKAALFEFYNDILTYDEEGCDEYESKEVYIKEVAMFFEECPAKTNAQEFIRAVYDASPVSNKTIVLGYIKESGEMVLFDGNQREKEVNLTNNDRIIVFSNH